MWLSEIFPRPEACFFVIFVRPPFILVEGCGGMWAEEGPTVPCALLPVNIVPPYEPSAPLPTPLPAAHTSLEGEQASVKIGAGDSPEII